jgi:hypothetical protein
MALPSPGPVILSVAGDQFVEPAQIRAILWEGATTAGDTVEVRERLSGAILFRGRAVGTQTWEGVVLPLTAPTGFRLAHIASGQVFVYLDEP